MSMPPLLAQLFQQNINNFMGKLKVERPQEMWTLVHPPYSAIIYGAVNEIFHDAVKRLATRVWIYYDQDPFGYFRFYFMDDGMQFDPASLEDESELRNRRDDAQANGGNIQAWGTDNGTVICLIIRVQ